MRWWALAPVAIQFACQSRGATERAAETQDSSAASATGVNTAPPPVLPAGSGRVAAPGQDPLQLRVTPSDLLLERPGAPEPVFSYAAWARAVFEQEIAPLAGTDAGAPRLVRELDVTPISWVGSLLAVKQTTFTPSSAHPAGETRVLTLRIEATAGDPARAQAVSLTELFGEPMLLRELQHEPSIERALKSAAQKPTTLAELVRLLGASDGALGGCRRFPEDLLQRFSFGRLEDERLVVHLTPWRTETCFMLGNLELLLAPPAGLTGALRDARDGRAGFFARDKPAGLTTVHLRMTSQERTPGMTPAPTSSAHSTAL
jgi:hypothetical protein